MEDNNVYVKVKLDTSGFKLGTKEMSQHVTDITNKLKGMSASAQANCNNAANAFMKQNQAVANATAEVEKLERELANAKNQSSESSWLKKQFSEVDKDIAVSTKELREFQYELGKLEKNGKGNSNAAGNVRQTINSIKTDIARQEAYKASLRSDPRAYVQKDTSALESKLAKAKARQADAINKASTAYQKFNNVVNENNQKIKENVVTTGRLEKSAKRVKSSTNSINASFKKGLATILKYTLGLQTLFVVWRKLREALIDGFSTLAKKDKSVNKAISSIKTQLSTLKNSFAAAFTPLLTTVAPIIEAFLKKLNAVMVQLSKFIAIISGQKTYKVATEVWQDYARSLNKAGKSAKDAKKYLSGLDEIQQYDGKTGSGFKDVAIEKSALDMFDNIKAKIKELTDLFKKGFLAGLGDFKPRIQSIIDSIQRIKKALLDIFTDPGVAASAKTMVDKIVYALGQMIGSLVSIGISIGQAIFGGVAKFLDEKKDSIKEKLQAAFDIIGDIAELYGNFYQTIAYILEVLGGENGIGLFANTLSFIYEILSNVYLIGLKIWRDIAQVMFQPIIDNAEKIREALDNLLGLLSGFMGFLAGVAKDIGDNVQKLYDEHIKPFIDKITKSISTFVGIFLDWWNNSLAPTLKKIGGEVKTLYDNYIKPVIDKLFIIIGKVIDIISKLWEIVEPYIIKFMNDYLPKLSEKVQSTWNKIKPVIEFGASVFSAAFDVIIGILDAVIALLEGDFPGAAEKAKDGFLKAFNDLVPGLKSLLNSLIDKINDFTSRINEKINLKIPEWIPEFGGKSISFQIPEIPHLAKGAVIPPNAPFLAQLGDQKNGTNLEAPENLIRQIMREEGGNGTYRFTAEINRKVLFDEVIAEAKLRQSANGRNPFEFA